MKESKKEVENAVLKVGDSLGIGDSVKILLTNIGIYSTIKEVVYKAFVDNKTDYFEKDDLTFESYQIVRTYCKEMSLNGEVNFNVPYQYFKK
jgi:hypothetical protein